MTQMTQISKPTTTGTDEGLLPAADCPLPTDLATDFIDAHRFQTPPLATAYRLRPLPINPLRRLLEHLQGLGAAVDFLWLELLGFRRDHLQQIILVKHHH